MKSLLALVITVLTACAIAHPGYRTSGSHIRRVRNGPLHLTNDELSELMTQMESDPIGRESVNHRHRRYLSAYLMDRGRIPYPPPKAPELNLLNEEIERIGNMPEKSQILYKTDSEMPWLSSAYERIIGLPVPYTERTRYPSMGHKYPQKLEPSNVFIKVAPLSRKPPILIFGRPFETKTLEQVRAYEEKQNERKIFALTPMDEEYFAPAENAYSRNTTSEGPHEGGGQKPTDQVDRRQIRQNPNLSRAKTLIAEDLDKLRQGVSSENLGSTVEPRDIDVFGTNIHRETFYLVVISAGVAATLFLAISVLTYGFFVLVKRAKAAAAVDYPAYGVTGPTVDTSGDRRLAQSAQMYHYQHQKQQIIAMERNTTEQRNGSLSDPESEEENEEGDYTVYECPGFATTGDMEVRNPLFDEPTPATPGKVQVVQPQPKE